MKKKFLLYIAVIVTCLFLGFTIYYLAKNNENIYLNMSNDESIYINVNESIAWPVVWTKPYKDTTMSVAIGDENVLSYDENTQKFVGISGGFTSVTITPSNKNFGPFVFEVYVGDGKLGSPFVLKSAEDVAKIGSNAQFKNTMYYVLANDIDMKAYNQGKWTPVAEFAGNLNGNGHTIYNLDIVDTPNAGLFGTVTASGTVENIKFSKVNIQGAFTNVGAVAGINKGLIGKVDVLSGTITNTKTSSNTGAIVGSNLYGGNPAYINMCSSNISMVSAGNMGGLVGLNKSSVILNSKAVVNEFTASTAGVYAGGLAGVNESTYDATTNTFYASAIAKSYSVVESATGTSNVGAVVGYNKENNNNDNYFTNKYENVIYALGNGTTAQSIAKGGSVLSSSIKSEIKSSSKSDLLIKDTYTEFNFDSVWTKEDTSYANINFLGTYESIILKGVGLEKNSDSVDLTEFLKSLKSNLNQTCTYTVTKNTVVDLGGMNWQTIAPDSTNPLKVSIVVNSGVTCKITNFKLTGANSSFFGYISGNTIIKGLTFDSNITINNSVADNTAVVATGLLNGATLENITVKNLTSFASPAGNIGLIAARNSGTIKNAIADYRGNVVVASSGQKHIGGIVGYNGGYITECTTEYFTLEINTKNGSNGNFNIGGTAGISETGISNNAVKAFKLNTGNQGTMYVGGVVGYIPSGTVSIYKCYAYADIDLGVNNSNAYLAGVVGYTSGGATVSASVYAGGTLRASNVGGLVGIHYGTLNSSYSAGTLKGNKVAGLATLCYKNISNCYTISSLVGDNKNSITNGVTGLVGPDCLIEKCLINARFSGEGEKYAESESPFRMLWISKQIFSFRGDVDFGVVSNLIIVNYGNAKTQSSIFGIKSGWVSVTDEDCRGKDGYAVLKEKAGFDSSVWNFDNSGSYPTLRDIAI